MSKLKSTRIIEENATYISLQDATKHCPYSQEYLSLRARQGKLRALKRGRNWVTTREWIKEYENGMDMKRCPSQSSWELLLAQRFFILFFALVIVLLFVYVLLSGGRNNLEEKKISWIFDSHPGRFFENNGSAYFKGMTFAGIMGGKLIASAEAIGNGMSYLGFSALKGTALISLEFGEILRESEMAMFGNMRLALCFVKDGMERIDRKWSKMAKETAEAWKNSAANIPKTEEEFNELVKSGASWEKTAQAREVNDHNKNAAEKLSGAVDKKSAPWEGKIFKYTNLAMQEMIRGIAFFMDKTVSSLDHFFYRFE